MIDKAKIRKAHKVYTNEDGVQMCEMEFSKYLEMEKALTPPTAEEVKEYIDTNFEWLVHYPLSFSENNGKYYMMAHYERKEISKELIVALIKEVKGEIK
jgi:hypothetical protein